MKERRLGSGMVDLRRSEADFFVVKVGRESVEQVVIMVSIRDQSVPSEEE